MLAVRNLTLCTLAGPLAIGTLASGALSAQATVKVVDEVGRPVPYTAVQIGGAVERAADTLGIVRLPKGEPKPQMVRARRIGFAPFASDVTPSPGGVYHVVLSPMVNGLDTVRTVATMTTMLSRTGFYDRMQRVHNGAMLGEFITPEELEARNASFITNLMRGRRYVGVTRGKNNKVMVTGRGGMCGMTILLDGVRVNNTMEESSQNLPTSINMGSNGRPGAAAPVSLDEMVTAHEVMAIEVYPSTANAPAELIPLTGGGSCGIIAIWTGPRR